VAPSTIQGPELLVGSVPKATNSEILAGFPPRSVVDLLVEWFYETPEFSPNIHIPTFKREVRLVTIGLALKLEMIESTKTSGQIPSRLR
jgi:hypothetical protein